LWFNWTLIEFLAGIVWVRCKWRDLRFLWADSTIELAGRIGDGDAEVHKGIRAEHIGGDGIPLDKIAGGKNPERLTVASSEYQWQRKPCGRSKADRVDPIRLKTQIGSTGPDTDALRWRPKDIIGIARRHGVPARKKAAKARFKNLELRIISSRVWLPD
jgi:hypothetical protein